MQAKLPESDHVRRHWMMILAIAGLVRLLYLVFFLASPLHGYHFADHIYYRNWGMQIARGNWFGEEVFEQGPLYAYFLAMAFQLGLSETLVLVVQLVIGLATPILVYESGRRLFDQKTALVAAILVGIYGPLVFYEGMLMKSFLLPLLTTAVLYCSLRYREKLRPGWLCAVGALIGLACLVRENHVLYLVPMSVWIWWCGAGGDTSEKETLRIAPWRRGLHLGALVGSLALVILPVTLRNYSVAGEWVPVTSGGGEVLYLAHGPEANGYFHTVPFVKPSPWREHEDFRVEAARRTGKSLSHGEASQFWRQAAWDEVWLDPGRSLLLTFLKGRIFFHDLEVPDSADYKLWRNHVPLMWLLPTFGWCLGLGLLGCVVCLRSPGNYQLVLGLLAVHLVSVLVTYNFGRFRIGMLPLLLLLAVHGMMWLIRGLKASGGKRRAAWAGLMLALVTSGWSFTTPPGYSLEAYQAKVPITLKGIEEQRLARQDLASLQPLLSRRPTDGLLYSRMGHNYTLLGYRHEAIDHHERAIVLAPGSAEVFMGYGYDLVTLGLPQMAVDPLVRSLQLNPDFDVAHKLLGDYYREQGDFDTAITHFRAAVQINPQQQLLAANALAVMLVTHPDPASRNAAEAVKLAKHVHQALQAQGQPSPQVLYTLADAYAESGQRELAIQTIQVAMRLAQDTGQLQFSQQLEVRFRQYQQMP
jgi:tetratricopeptide (TPR) repeat protein